MKVVGFCILVFFCSCSYNKDKIVVQKGSISPQMHIHDETEEIFGLSYVAGPREITEADMLPVKHTNANYIAVIPFAIGTSGESHLRFDDNNQWWGETTVGVKKTIDLAREQGLKIMVKPQIWFRGGAYSGHFELHSEKEWINFETNYRAYVLKFAKIAAETKTEIFCVGTELETFIDRRLEFWKDLIVEIRLIYKGKLTYAANWDAYKNTWIWKDLDLIAVDAYFPLSNEKVVTKDSLAIGWEPWLIEMENVSKKYDKKVLFAECGYRSIEYAAKRPWESDNINRTVHLDNQKTLYSTMFEEAWSKPWIIGGFIWKWFPEHKNSGGEQHIGFTPQNKPAEHVLRHNYSKWQSVK